MLAELAEIQTRGERLLKELALSLLEWLGQSI